ncbi:hypothetical protein BS47DRAFT_1378494 [Hydnum rufescens UP504]|uniref:Uncharacterized protein n=1 Tax=Hydnum rufescens UP504 TaxID=1448309 RepID=A0A9P6E014_9AGAM|nr:hypothetical protein BS47DRAFT_1378494 [Hydnum rufescens UP504]
MFSTKLPQGPLGRILSEGNQESPSGSPSANAVQQPGDASTAKKPASLFPIPLNNPIGGALNLVQGGVESGLKGLGGATETVLSSAPQIPVPGLGDGVSLVKSGLDGLKNQAGAVLTSAPQIPVVGLGEGASLVKNGLGGLKDQADAVLANAPKLPGVPGVPGIGDGANNGIPFLSSIPGPFGALLSGFVPSSGVLGDVAKLQTFVHTLYLIPGRIVAFLNKWSWISDIPKLIQTFFSPSFDLREAVIKFSSQGIKLTLVGVVLSSIAAWFFFFLALVNSALFFSIAPVFGALFFLLGFEISFVELLRYTGKKKQS